MDYETEKQAVEMLRAGRLRIDAELSKVGRRFTVGALTAACVQCLYGIESAP